LAAAAAWIILLSFASARRRESGREKSGRIAMTTSRDVAPGRSSAAQMPVHIRWMIRRDMPDVLGIEEQSFEFPWSEEDFVRCLRQRNCIGMVAEHNERVVGFMIYELHKTRLHILNFAVDQQQRRRGVGSQMVKKLAGKLSPQRRSRIMLEIRETNLPAQLFFRAQGFRAVSVLRAFYDDTPEDAYLMQLRYSAAMAAADTGRQTRLAG
jgi:ribosomal-protein-alanine N-acetyltransferase